MVQALGIVKEIAGNQVVARSLADVEVGVREGRRRRGAARALGRVPAARHPDDLGRRGHGQARRHAAQGGGLFRPRGADAIQQFTRLLEPVLILVMGLVVGFIVVSMLSAIFSVNDLPM